MNLMVKEGVPLESVAPLMSLARKSEGVAEVQAVKKKSRIRETSNLLTAADCRTATILESLRNLSREKKEKINGAVDASMRPRVHAYTRPRVHTTDPRGGDGRSAPTPRF